MNITTKPVEYMDGKTKCIGFMAWDETYADPKPCVMIGHSWTGRGRAAEDKAIAMAAQGYIGFAIDVYGDGQTGEGPEQCAALMSPFTSDRAMLLKRLKAAYKAAKNLDQVDAKNIAMIGYCFGGLCALDLARYGADLKSAISFHGLFTPNGLPAKKIKASVLALHGYDDPLVPPAEIAALGDELTKAGCDWQIHAYGGTGHAFTAQDANDPKNGMMYNEAADRRSWAAATDLLLEHFGRHGSV